ncbi:MAG: hypothetical protein PHR25_02450 [Clostridia bacterium]|nr:hypothetical protein [Clostridia bacterium]MDD4375620.1 hypothetical protein [Clostridia bacterium]
MFGIPAYTILWTEKSSKVVAAEIYSLNAIADYINKNKLEKKFHLSTEQNYIEFKKGTLTYKMWVEDSKSIQKRIEIIKGKDINKLAVYKQQYSNNEMWKTISNWKKDK